MKSPKLCAGTMGKGVTQRAGPVAVVLLLSKTRLSLVESPTSLLQITVALTVPDRPNRFLCCLATSPADFLVLKPRKHYAVLLASFPEPMPRLSEISFLPPESLQVLHLQAYQTQGLKVHPGDFQHRAVEQV